MSLQDRIDSLRSRHQELETTLEGFNGQSHPDDIELHDLKKQKLALKDEIAQLETQV